MHKLHFIGLLIVGLLSSLFSCQPSVDPDSETATILAKNIEDIETYAVSKGLSGTLSTSGLYYVVTQASSSTVLPALGQELEFSYKLYVLNGPSNTTVTSGVTDTLVDSAYADTSVFYPFFENSLKPGLQETFLQMNEGQKVIVLMPSALAFGSVATTTPAIPANSPVRYDIYLKRTRTEAQQIQEYISSNNLTVTEQTTSGLYFIKTKSVDTTANPLPTNNQTITINAVGTLFHASTAFDSRSSVQTELNQSAMAGFNQGLAKLRAGEKATLIFPSTLGYSDDGYIENGLYVVPPNTPIRYDIEVVSIK